MVHKETVVYENEMTPREALRVLLNQGNGALILGGGIGIGKTAILMQRMTAYNTLMDLIERDEQTKTGGK